MGVGPYGDQVESGNTFSQIWNGRTWRTVAVPSVNLSQGLFGVACTSARHCIAVGGQNFDSGVQLSDEWNGSSWKKLPSPVISGHSELRAVACPAASQCIAVGAGAKTAAAQTWNGTSWTLTPSPVVPAGATSSSFDGVACSGASSCLAVGSYRTKTDPSGAISLAESWNGHAWTLLPSPASLTVINAVACPAVQVCVGVGAGQDGEFSIASAEWNGSSWTPLTTPSPTVRLSTQSLYGISCTSPANCVAVGSGPGALDPGSGVGPFAEHWTGGSGWSLEPVPDPKAVGFEPDGEPAADNGLSGVSCTSPDRCMAVGGEGQTQVLSAYASFAVSWNGSRWSVSRTGRVDGLMGVSCAPGGDCLMTGTYLNGSDATESLAESWNGSHVRLVSPKGLTGILSAVSCPSATFCVAANESSAASWNGSRWTWTGPISHTAYDRQATGIIYHLSCVSRGFCMATGGFQEEFSEFWNGRSWHKATFKKPNGTGVVDLLTGLSCVSRNFCLATGSYSTLDGDGNGGPLVEAWNGSAWRIISAPRHIDTVDVAACRTSSSCMTIGTGGVPGKTIFFGASWNGHAWKITQIPGAYGLGLWQGSLSGNSSLSCPTATSCVAVGSFAPIRPGKPVVYSDIGLIWNGRSWRRTAPGGPAGITSVSCASPHDCVAIGLPGIATLAKLWNGSAWRTLTTSNP